MCQRRESVESKARLCRCRASPVAYVPRGLVTEGCPVTVCEPPRGPEAFWTGCVCVCVCSFVPPRLAPGLTRRPLASISSRRARPHLPRGRPGTGRRPARKPPQGGRRLACNLEQIQQEQQPGLGLLVERCDELGGSRCPGQGRARSPLLHELVGHVGGACTHIYAVSEASAARARLYVEFNPFGKVRVALSYILSNGRHKHFK